MLRGCARLLRATAKNGSFRMVPAVGYKSQYSVDKLYPNSNPDFISNPVLKHTKTGSQGDEEFTGFIPIEKINIKYCRSSGPGGQHVNTVNTKVEMRFHVASAEWIPDWVKPKLMEKESGRITKEGFLIVSCDKTRKQVLNQAECVDRIRVLVRNAAQKPYEPTEEDLALHESRLEKQRLHRLKEKKTQSMRKQRRASPTIHSV